MGLATGNVNRGEGPAVSTRGGDSPTGIIATLRDRRSVSAVSVGGQCLRDLRDLRDRRSVSTRPYVRPFRPILFYTRRYGQITFYSQVSTSATFILPPALPAMANHKPGKPPLYLYCV